MEEEEEERGRERVWMVEEEGEEAWASTEQPHLKKSWSELLH